MKEFDNLRSTSRHSAKCAKCFKRFYPTNVYLSNNFPKLCSSLKTCTVACIPFSVRAQNGDTQDKIHHERRQDHSKPQEDGSIFSGLQSRHRLLLVQYIYLAKLLVDWPDDRRWEGMVQIERNQRGDPMAHLPHRILSTYLWVWEGDTLLPPFVSSSWFPRISDSSHKKHLPWWSESSSACWGGTKRRLKTPE